jgi:hypothetical protein
MRQLRYALLAAVAVALCTAPLAGAGQPRGDGRGAVVTPAQARWLGEFEAQIYSLPASENPWVGNGNPCMTVGHKVLQEIGGPCTMEEGWVFTLGYGSGWSNVEDPFPETEAQQCAVAQAQDAVFVDIHVVVDGGRPVDIYSPRFEHCTPQRTVLVPADNILDVPGPVVATVTGHGWGAAVRNLRPGRHTIVADATLADGSHWTVPHTVIIVPRHTAHSQRTSA